MLSAQMQQAPGATGSGGEDALPRESTPPNRHTHTYTAQPQLQPTYATLPPAAHVSGSGYPGAHSAAAAAAPVYQQQAVPAYPVLYQSYQMDPAAAAGQPFVVQTPHGTTYSAVAVPVGVYPRPDLLLYDDDPTCCCCCCCCGEQLRSVPSVAAGAESL